jgi:hypothetical protein
MMMMMPSSPRTTPTRRDATGVRVPSSGAHSHTTRGTRSVRRF